MLMLKRRTVASPPLVSESIGNPKRQRGRSSDLAYASGYGSIRSLSAKCSRIKFFVQRNRTATAWIAIGVTIWLAQALPTASAQSVGLPAPRLLTTIPMGGQVGTEVEITITGQNIDNASQLRFSHPSISAQPKLGTDGQPENNKYIVNIGADCPVGVHEASVMTRLGISTSRAFTVGDLPETMQVKPNVSLANAMPLQINAICNGVMSQKSVDHYSFEAKAGQRIIVDCAARGIDSKLYAVLIVADSKGRDLVVERRGGAIDFNVPEDGLYIVKVHELTFKGGPEFFYRLALREVNAAAKVNRLPSTSAVSTFSWPPVGLVEQAAAAEAEPNDDHSQAQKITLPCDLAGSFFPAADTDVFEFTATKGDVWWVEVGSARLGLLTDPSVVVQHVGVDDQGNETLTDVAELTDIASPVKVSSNAYSYDGPPYDAGSADVLGKVEIKQDGLYRLQLSDLFGGTRNDPGNVYRLIIRKAAPDFAVVAWALHMNLRNGDRNALSKPIALRQGATMPLEVVVVRRDGFAGEIELAMDGLPDGVTAGGLKIPSGKTKGIMLITADQGAPQGVSCATFVGSAQIGGEMVTRPCRLASMAWPVPNAWSEIPAPRLLADVPVSVSGSEVAPITIAARDQKVWEVTAGQKLTIPLIHMRRCQFSGETMGMKTFGAGFESMPQFDVPLTADSSEVVLDLAKLKTPPGDYTIAFYGSAVAKHRHNPNAIDAAKQSLDAVKAEAAEITVQAKTLADQAKVATGQEKAASEQAAHAAAANQTAAAAKVESATKRLTAVTNAAKPKDIVDIIVSQPIAIRVQPAETK